MFVHAVYFWLDRNLTRADEERFKQRLEELGTIPTVKHCFVGRPAATNRPIIDRTYSFSLTLVRRFRRTGCLPGTSHPHQVHESCAKM